MRFAYVAFFVLPKHVCYNLAAKTQHCAKYCSLVVIVPAEATLFTVQCFQFKIIVLMDMTALYLVSALQTF